MTEQATAAATAASNGITFLQAWSYGGWLMWVLAALSVLALALVIYLVLVHRSASVVPGDLVSDVLGRLQDNDPGEARRLCERRPCAFSDVTLAALDAVRTAPQGSAARVKETLETAGAHVAGRIHATTEYLLDIATIAPLVGLLGTVLGMFKAFGAVANDVASAKPVVLAEGVSQAIVTTVFGLLIAIPVMVAYAFLRRRAARRVDELETAAADVAAALESRPSSK